VKEDAAVPYPLQQPRALNLAKWLK